MELRRPGRTSGMLVRRLFGVMADVVGRSRPRRPAGRVRATPRATTPSGPHEADLDRLLGAALAGHGAAGDGEDRHVPEWVRRLTTDDPADERPET